MSIQEAVDSWLTAIKLQGHGCGVSKNRINVRHEFWSVGNGKDNLIIVHVSDNSIWGVYNLYDDSGITSEVRCHKKINSDDVGLKKALKEITSWVALL
ncbi:hypothetical protein D3C81_921750 [compost metagenome]